MGRQSSRAEASASGSNFKLYGALLAVTLMLWLIIAVVFGGLGGHLFSQFSRLGFLGESHHSYYATEEEMLAARRAYKARSRAAAKKRKIEEKNNQKTESEYAEKKSGVLIYRKSTQGEALLPPADENRIRGGDGLRPAEEVERDLADAAQAKADSDAEIAALEAKAKEEEELTDEEKEQARQDSDEDIRSIKDAAGDDLEKRDILVDDTRIVAEETVEPKDPLTKTVYAYDVSLISDDKICREYDIRALTTDIRFRHGSAAIKGLSLNALDSLVDLFKNCPESHIVVTQNPMGLQDSKDNEALQLRRQDEIKYYLLHRRIPKESIAMREQF